MKNCIIASIVFLQMIIANASVPTVEGLFRNGANPDLTGDTVAINIVLSEQRAGEEEGEVLQLNSYYKLIFSVSKGQPTRAIQVRYIDPALNINQVVDVKSFENLRATLSQESNFNRLLTYSLVMMYALNDSSGFDQLLKRYGRGYLSNNETINQDKKRLYAKYRDHLREKKEGASPLAPEDDEEKKVVNDILAARFYENTEKIHLVRQGGEFLWEVNLDTFRAYFDHSNRMMRKMNIATFQGEVVVDVGPYSAVNGNFEIPAFILIKHEDGRQMRVTLSGYQDFNSRNKRFAERITDYQRFMQQSLQRINKETVSEMHIVEYMY